MIQAFATGVVGVWWLDEPLWGVAHRNWPPSTGLVGGLASAWSNAVLQATEGDGEVWDCVEWLATVVRRAFAPRCRNGVPDDPMRKRFRKGPACSVLEHAGPLPVLEPSFPERNLREALAWA